MGEVGRDSRVSRVVEEDLCTVVTCTELGESWDTPSLFSEGSTSCVIQEGGSPSEETSGESLKTDLSVVDERPKAKDTKGRRTP